MREVRSWPCDQVGLPERCRDGSSRQHRPALGEPSAPTVMRSTTMAKRPRWRLSLARPAKNHVVLEVGTGSEYQAAVLSRLVARVYTVEIVEPLAREAAANLKRTGYDNVMVRAGDGYNGCPRARSIRRHCGDCGCEPHPAAACGPAEAGWPPRPSGWGHVHVAKPHGHRKGRARRYINECGHSGPVCASHRRGQGRPA
jgi:Protein-L-isoaspartate(D-aspartate) O-methyltransferase (PCMT)